MSLLSPPSRPLEYPVASASAGSGQHSTDAHHDHLIDVKSGRVVEFQNEEIEELQDKIARAHGMKLVGHRLELYGIPLKEGE